MKKSVALKIQNLIKRYTELDLLLKNSANTFDRKQLLSFSKEYASITTIMNVFEEYKKVNHDMRSVIKILNDNEEEIKSLAQEEEIILKEKIRTLCLQLEVLLLPKNINDKADIFLEIRAGTGGDEASIFAGNLFRMYSRYSEKNGWVMETITESLGEHSGYKEIIVKIIGKNVYSFLKFESGTHRVQRVPRTESQGRIHTSVCTVVVLPEVDDSEKIVINPKDLKIDTFRASGAGGQHVNKTNSAIRIKHEPTGIVVECQDQRSQHRNRLKAMSVLQAKIVQHAKNKQQTLKVNQRRNLLDSGDRSERIRTYNYPQGRVTDHRINLTLYKIEEIMDGSLDILVDSLMLTNQAQLLDKTAQ